MCLVVVAVGAHPAWPLVVAANRDEFLDRPAEPAAFWPDAPEVLAGRDRAARGTWMGITRGGRFAALTNFRDPRSQRPDAPSRGALVAGFLRSAEPPAAWLEALAGRAAAYNPFTLLAGDPSGLHVFSSRTGRGERVAQGLHGLSNAFLDTPWPKVVRTRNAVSGVLARHRDQIDAEALLAPLADRTRAPDAELPDTGVGLEWERVLSSPFIEAPGYGTRCSTVLTIDRHGTARLRERTFDGARVGGPRDVAFELEVPPWGPG